jgi:hypothetical protein
MGANPPEVSGGYNNTKHRTVVMNPVEVNGKAVLIRKP